jgi:hypothetical protein
MYDLQNSRLLRSVGKPYAGEQVEDEAENVGKRKWLKAAYMH